MKYPLDIGIKVPEEKLEPDLFQAHEGFIQLIYGRVRQGKSTEAVRRMVEALSNGISVYSNIALDLSDLVLDDRVNAGIVLINSFLFKRRFYSFSVNNYHYFDPVTGNCDGKRVFNPETKGDEIRWLNTLTDCEVYYDEGQWLLDSYESTFASVAKRKLITESGHVNRLIVIIAQRTQSVHVNARGNVNQFFKCQKLSFFGLFNVFTISEFQDMKGQDVDELSEPVSVKRYITNRAYWRLFNTHYLRRGRPRSQVVRYEAYDVNFFGRVLLLLWGVFGFVLPALKLAKRRFVSVSPFPKDNMAFGGGDVDASPPSVGVKSGDQTLKNRTDIPYQGILSPLSRGTGSIQRSVGGVGTESDLEDTPF